MNNTVGEPDFATMEDYWKACGCRPDDPLDIRMKKTLWGTYGLNGDQPLKWVRLIDCSTDHLQAILRQPHISQISHVSSVAEAIIRSRQ